MDVLSIDDEKLEEFLKALQEKFNNSAYGFELKKIAGKYQFRTKPEFSEIIRSLKDGGPRRLSPAALETLAIVAYRQPIIKSDIEKIRGVDASPTIKTLLERKIIKIVGHLPTPGQPALYGTTEQFLETFGISSLSELPTLRDIKEFEEEPGEANQGEANQGELSLDSNNSDTPDNIIKNKSEEISNTQDSDKQVKIEAQA
ncbi:UNVERIFIED_CONTAM: hypothetical protein GTU68_053383 [Idotea baltica]|nr:hypothetical protein [Idotea baltica]